MSNSFFNRINIIRVEQAGFFAADLFWESFRVPFPVPRDNCGLPISTPPHKWNQYVAFYKDSVGSFKTVGFCNWIRYGDMYLEGGMCVDRNFYRSLTREEWTACRDAGGVAQLMMETAASQLNDASAWFGYCGDKKAYLVDLRAGYVATQHKYLIVKWFKDVTPEHRESLIALAAAIGPF